MFQEIIGTCEYFVSLAFTIDGWSNRNRYFMKITADVFDLESLHEAT